jgi:hypothetical protein
VHVHVHESGQTQLPPVPRDVGIVGRRLDTRGSVTGPLNTHHAWERSYH